MNCLSNISAHEIEEDLLQPKTNLFIKHGIQAVFGDCWHAEDRITKLLDHEKRLEQRI